MKSYGQYCPIARTSELLAERWTPIIIRNLLAGCSTFAHLREGAPGIPKALLYDRLALLERHGVVSRDPGRGGQYALTQKGFELKDVCDAMGNWGARWLEMTPDHLDAGYALWATCRLADMAKVPEPGVVVHVTMRGDDRHFWMMLVHPRAEMCLSSMGREEDLRLTADAQSLVQFNLRQLTFGQALRSGSLQLEGPPRLVRAFPTWFRPSPFAAAAAVGPGG